MTDRFHEKFVNGDGHANVLSTIFFLFKKTVGVFAKKKKNNFVIYHRQKRVIASHTATYK